MLASEYKPFENVADTMQRALSDKEIRLKCEARERYERDRISLYASGKREGHASGRMEGLAEGQNLLSQLMSKLFADNRIEDAKRATQDPDFREQLYHEYGF